MAGRRLASPPPLSVSANHICGESSCAWRAFDGSDALLARAGGAAVLLDRFGRTLWRHSGQVRGLWAAVRAELQAALLVVEGCAGWIPLVTACKRVHLRSAALAEISGGVAAARQGTDANLWPYGQPHRGSGRRRCYSWHGRVCALVG